MLKNIRILGYRCFKDFEVKKLARVNLLVGKNNSGKTSLLEAVEVLVTGSSIALGRSLVQRSEWLQPPDRSIPYDFKNRPILDISSLFTGFRIDDTAAFRIEGSGADVRMVICEVAMGKTSEGNDAQFLSLHAQVGHLRFTGDAFELGFVTGVLRDSLFFPKSARAPAAEAIFVPADALSQDFIANLYDGAEKLATDHLVHENLAVIMPEARRVYFHKRAGYDDRLCFVGLVGTTRLVPIGSFGGGATHLLGILVSLANAKDGYLLIDEIDTGLHYTVLTKMWKLVIEASKQLNVQVFATTHSLDCIRALARVCEELDASEEDVLLHRLEREGDSSWPVTVAPDQLGRMVANDLELR